MYVMGFKFGFLISAVLLIASFFSCESEDINPVLSLEIEHSSLSEDGGTTVITAGLNGPASGSVTIPLNFSGTASASDYSLSAEIITISRGDSTGSITITGTLDEIEEGNETIEVSVSNTSGFLVLSDQNFTITILDGNTDTDGDGVPDAADECPDTVGDANGDGTRAAQADEFIESYNSTASTIDLSGYTIFDNDELRHTFPEGTVVPSNGVIVVFGGGTPTGSFGGAIVQAASEGRLNMNNAGDIVTLREKAPDEQTPGDVVLTFDINPLSNDPDEAYTRSPDIYGDFVQYTNVPEAGGALFTPGTKLDGSAF